MKGTEGQTVSDNVASLSGKDRFEFSGGSLSIEAATGVGSMTVVFITRRAQKFIALVSFSSIWSLQMR